jgi:hypothetical protein
MSEREVDSGEEVLRDAPPGSLSEDERSQISARLRLTPADRLKYLMDMLAFEERARQIAGGAEAQKK